MAGTPGTKTAWPGRSVTVDTDRHAGTVTRGERRIVTFDVDITPLTTWDEGAEFVIRVNGRTLRRMTAAQARWLGVLYDADAVEH